MNPLEFEQALQRLINSKPMTLNQLREAGLIGRNRKYPYDEVVEALNKMKDKDINEDSVWGIINWGNMRSSMPVGKKKIYGLVKNEKVKETIKQIFKL